MKLSTINTLLVPYRRLAAYANSLPEDVYPFR